jgi:RND family efflux transporter MFP subunit
MALLPTLVVCAALVVAGALLLLLIFNTEPVAERETAVRQTASLVDVVSPEAGSFRPQIEVLGVVRPAQSLDLRPRVSGAVEMLSPALQPGAFVSQGDVLLRIEDADYRNLLLQREGELQQARAELEIEQGRQEIAERDYRALQRELAADNRALVLRQPQLRSAEASVKAAEAAAGQAQLNLDRTVITAPFDAQVMERNVDLGSQVTPGDSLARLVGVERYWVEATVPLDRLRWLEFNDGAAADGQAAGGSPVEIRHRAAWGNQPLRRGYLDQLIGELDGGTRMARVLVVVDDPLGLEAPADALPPLIIGGFVEATIQGREIDAALRLPRDTVRQDDTVWLLRDGALAITPVDIVFQDAGHAYIAGGLAADDLVVTTNLTTVRNGLALRQREPSSGEQPLAATQP